MTLLHINCCISPNRKPRTAQLAEAFISAYSAAHPDARVEEYVLETCGLTPLDKNALVSRDSLIRAGKSDAPCFAPARQFASADRIVVSAPYWELSFPSMLRVYIENISVLGVAFGYAENGRELGLCRAKRMIYLTCAGGQIEGRDLGADYMRAMCGVFGIPHFDSVSAENQDVIGGDGTERLSAAVLRAAAIAKNF